MLEKLLTPFTTAAPTGVALRDAVLALGVLLTTLGGLGLMSEERRAMLQSYLDALADPTVLAAISLLAGFTASGAVSIYRIVTKSHSDKAAEVAKQVDAKIPKSEPVIIETPDNVPNIVVPGEQVKPG